MIVGAQDEVPTRKFHIFHGTTAILADGIHIGFALSVRLQRIVVAVKEDSCPGQKAGVHAHTFPGIHLDNDEAFPIIAVAFGFGA